MTNVEKIRAEIARMQDRLMDDDSNFTTQYDEGAYDVLCKLDAYCNSLLEEPGKDLEEVAEEYAKYTAAPPTDIAYHFCRGAQWQKEQLIDKACKWLQGFMRYSPLFEYLVPDDSQKEVIDELKEYLEGEE